MSTLLRQLGEEIALLQAFTGLLAREAEALAERRFDQLPEIARRKDQAADRLAKCDAEREQLLAALGHPADRAGADAAAAQAGPAVQQAWERVLALAAQARQQNHRNGVMVHAHLEFTRQGLAFLQTGTRPLYGPDGQHRAAGAAGARYAAA